MSGYTRAARCSNGTRSADRPRLPPTIEGDADSSKPWRGCGRKRDTQSIAFLSSPGTDALDSGEEITNALGRSSVTRNAVDLHILRIQASSSGCGSREFVWASARGPHPSSLDSWICLPPLAGTGRERHFLWSTAKALMVVRVKAPLPRGYS